jgi:hypothetical protein
MLRQRLYMMYNPLDDINRNRTNRDHTSIRLRGLIPVPTTHPSTANQTLLYVDSVDETANHQALAVPKIRVS